jgi:Myb-like DNA-binding protein BAS1
MTEKRKTVQINPLDITESLGYTTFRRDSRKPWTKEEDLTLRDLVNEKLLELGYPQGIDSLKETEWHLHSMDLPQRIDWEDISKRLHTRKSKDCRKRWMNSLDPNLRKGKWTAEEDQKLIDAFAKHGSSWQRISLEIPGRTDDQCAKRYIEVLDPNTKDRLRPWTEEEDLSLIKKVKAYGTKWRTISLEMESRPSLTCRNRWRKIVTDVVRGKTSPEIKKEIDSIQGGLSKLEEISETLKNEQKDGENEPLDEVVPARSTIQQLHPRKARHNNDGRATLGGSGLPFSNPGLAEAPKPTSTEMDWKFTLKDSSGLSLSSGVIATNELAQQLIEAVKQNDLKISLHQHIHHHYSSIGAGKGHSPEDSASNLSSHNQADDLITPNRYNHFNYLPAMAQPQLESSNLSSKESDLSRLLNPNNQQNHHNEQHQSQHQHQHQQGHHPSQHQSQRSQQYQHPGKKRRMSGSSNGSRKRDRRYSNEKRRQSETFLYDELDGEVDFWEKMGTLSQIVNSGVNNENKVSYRHQRGHNSSMQNDEHFNIMYGVFAEEDGEQDIEELEEELRGIAGILPFNPS